MFLGQNFHITTKHVIAYDTYLAPRFPFLYFPHNVNKGYYLGLSLLRDMLTNLVALITVHPIITDFDCSHELLHHNHLQYDVHCRNHRVH